MAGFEPAKKGQASGKQEEQPQPQIDILWGTLKDRLVQDGNLEAGLIRLLLEKYCEKLFDFPPTQPDQTPPSGEERTSGAVRSNPIPHYSSWEKPT